MLNKRNVFPLILSSVILLISLALMIKTSAREMDYYYYADSLDLIEITDAKDLTLEELENRNGKLIIEQVVGIVDDENGNGHGVDDNGYISYKSVDGATKGNVICTYFFYNPDTNYADDIIMRYDYIIDKKEGIYFE